MEPQKRPVKQILIFLAVFVPCSLVWLIVCGIGAVATATGSGMFRDGSSGKMNPMSGLAAFGVPLVVLMVGSIRVGIPLIRNPPRPSAGIRLMILLWIAAVVVPVGVCGFGVARVVWQARERAAAAHLPTDDEFRARWKGAPVEELRAAVGGPGSRYMSGGVLCESFYKKVAREPVNGRAYRHVDVYLSPDGLRITGVAFFP